METRWAPILLDKWMWGSEHCPVHWGSQLRFYYGSRVETCGETHFYCDCRAQKLLCDGLLTVKKWDSYIGIFHSLPIICKFFLKKRYGYGALYFINKRWLSSYCRLCSVTFVLSQIVLSAIGLWFAMQDHASDGTSIDVLPRISEADLQASRHRISAYLSTQTTYELLPQSGKVWIFWPWTLLWDHFRII